MIVPFSYGFSQDVQLTVSAKNKSITTSLENKNDDKLLLIDASQLSKNDFLTITIKNKEADKEWKRDFAIYDSADNALKDFVFMQDGSYCTKLTELVTLMKVQHNYFIYTVEVPKDPQKAMLVKPARKLVCKIRIL
jgi:lipopolysaccharide export LptBFGC system permease protein LptF